MNGARKRSLKSFYQLKDTWKFRLVLWVEKSLLELQGGYERIDLFWCCIKSSQDDKSHLDAQADTLDEKNQILSFKGGYENLDFLRYRIKSYQYNHGHLETQVDTLNEESLRFKVAMIILIYFDKSYVNVYHWIKRIMTQSVCKSFPSVFYLSDE